MGLFIGIATADSVTIKSLDKIDSVVKYSEGKALLDNQLHGKKSKSSFGTELPSWITSEALSKLVAPNESISCNTLLGLKSWRKKENTYVAIGCYADGKIDEKYKPYCGSYDKNNFVYLSVLEHKNSTTKLLSSIANIKIQTSWKNSQLQSGIEDFREDPQQYIKFDFAPYKVTKNSYAFGLRIGWGENYSGGGADFEALVLVVQEGKKLVVVFSEPMYAFSDIAGEWHEDGTREHDIDEEKNIVIVQKKMTNGYYNLKVKSLDSKFSKIFVFDKKKNRYVAKKQ